jgi:voltage-gated potassium channel
MVARVPLFAELRVGEIADIMRLLRAQQVEPGAIIARRCEPAHSMYFVGTGEVEIELKEQRIRFGPGHFYGEVAVLRRRDAPQPSLRPRARGSWCSMPTICMR